MCHALVLVEGGVGEGDALPAELQTAVRDFVAVLVLAGQAAGDLVLLQDDPAPVAGGRQRHPMSRDTTENACCSRNHSPTSGIARYAMSDATSFAGDSILCSNRFGLVY